MEVLHNWETVLQRFLIEMLCKEVQGLASTNQAGTLSGTSKSFTYINSSNFYKFYKVGTIFSPYYKWGPCPCSTTFSPFQNFLINKVAPNSSSSRVGRVSFCFHVGHNVSSPPGLLPHRPGNSLCFLPKCRPSGEQAFFQQGGALRESFAFSALHKTVWGWLESFRVFLSVYNQEYT